MKYITVVITIICLFFSPLVSAAEKEIDLATLLNSVKTMQAEFTQKIYDNRGKEIQKSFGHMALQRPGKFRWQVVKPIPQLIIAKDNKLWIYDADLEQVTIRSLNKSQSETPALLLSHVDSQLTNKFVFHSIPNQQADWHWYELKPKQADSMFAWIKMGFYKNQIKEMRLQDHLGHDTLIQFTEIKINNSLPVSLFTLKIPANVDVIDETRNA